jgi:uncharacterized circularly permuted ATP-grasp superfamily protein
VEVYRSKLNRELTSLLRHSLIKERSEVNNKESHVNLTSGNFNSTFFQSRSAKRLQITGVPQIGSSELKLGPIIRREDTSILLTYPFTVLWHDA